MISEPSGAPFVLYPNLIPRWLRELQMQARPRGSFQYQPEMLRELL